MFIVLFILFAWLGTAKNVAQKTKVQSARIRQTLYVAELFKESKNVPGFFQMGICRKRLWQTSVLTFFLESTEFFLGKSITTSILILYFGYSLRFLHNIYNVWLCAVQIRFLKNSTKKIIYAKFLYGIPPITKHTLNLSVCIIRMSTQSFTMLECNCR